MTYKICLLLAIAATVSTVAAGQSDARERGLRGRVRVVEQYETYFCCSPNQRRQLPRQLTGIAWFDRKGSYTAWISINNTTDGPYYERRVFTFGRNGRRTTAEVYRSEKNPENTFFKVVRSPNGGRKLLPEVAETLIERITYSYDRHGQMTGEISRDADGNVTMRRIFVHDRNGTLMRGTVIKEGGVIDTESITVRLDERTFETTYVRPGTDLQRSTYVKDSEGRTIKGESSILRTFGDNKAKYVTQNRSFTHYDDDRERRFDWLFYKPDGDPDSKIVILYDDRGEEASREEYNAGPLPPGSQNEGIEPEWTLRERTLYRRGLDRRGSVIRTERRQQCGPDLPLEITTIHDQIIEYY